MLFRASLHLALVVLVPTVFASVPSGGCGEPHRARSRLWPRTVGAPPTTPPKPPFETLAELGVPYKPWAPVRPGTAAGKACQVEEGVSIARGATGLRFSKPLRVRGDFAVKVARFEQVVQEEAQRVFGEPVVRLVHLGTYFCRPTAGAPHIPSQHAFGNAIDVSAFVLASGKRISVERHFVRRGLALEGPSGLFLQNVTRRLREERLFGSLLTPDYDQRHRDHLHLDGRSRSWWRLLS